MSEGRAYQGLLRGRGGWVKHQGEHARVMGEQGDKRNLTDDDVISCVTSKLQAGVSCDIMQSEGGLVSESCNMHCPGKNTGQ